MAASLSPASKARSRSTTWIQVAPWATNEEAYAAQKLARGLIGTENVDSSAGPVASAVSEALRGAFGTDALHSDLADLATANTIVVIADDLESSHNVAALRIKDAVVYNDARLVVISSRFGEVCDFIAPPPAGSIMPSPQRVRSAEPTGVWLRPSPGGETATVAALGRMLATRFGGEAEGPDEAPGVSSDDMNRAAEIIQGTGEGKLAIVYAPSQGRRARAEVARRHGQVLLDREVPVEGIVLGAHAEVALGACEIVAELVAVDADAPRLRPQKSVEHAEGGRLARPVGTEEAKDLPGVALEAHPVDHAPPAQMLDQIPCLEQRRHGVPIVQISDRGAIEPLLSFVLWSAP